MKDIVIPLILLVMVVGLAVFIFKNDNGVNNTINNGYQQSTVTIRSLDYVTD